MFERTFSGASFTIILSCLPRRRDGWDLTGTRVSGPSQPARVEDGLGVIASGFKVPTFSLLIFFPNERTQFTKL